MSEFFSVNVNAVKLRFASAHMATFGDDLEPLHGHNYIVSCTVDGALTNDGWIIDFSIIKKATEKACKSLDHKFLLQINSELIEINQDNDKWFVKFKDLEYMFPKNDVVALPIPNTTAEYLAKWLFDRIKEDILSIKEHHIHTMTVEVEEMPGQSGIYKSKI